MVAALKSHLTDGSDVRSRRVKLLGKGETFFHLMLCFMTIKCHNDTVSFDIAVPKQECTLVLQLVHA